MADGVDLAGVIGTWAAVFLALIALFGVVAPILLIRRSRSERQVALSSIDDGHYEFIDPGIKVPCLPGIARTISVPNLESPPKLMNRALIRYDNSLDEKRSGTDWIMFVRTLKAKNTSLPTGGTLKVYRSRSWLPVHRLWIFTLGLLGRYAYRPDQGRVQNAPTSRVDQRDSEANDRGTLYGITGFLRYSASGSSYSQEQDFGQVYFHAYDKGSRGSLQPDLVPFSTLFWLCMGCVPLLDGRVFDISRDLYQPPSYARRQRRRPQTVEPSDDAIPTRPKYRFKPVDDPSLSAWVILWAQTLFNGLPKIWWMCEYEVTKPEERADAAHSLQNLNDSEDVSNPWIKTESLQVNKYFKDPSLLWRSDVQSLALGILTMKWSPRGYLFDVRRGRFCRILIRPASHSLTALLEATCRLCESTTPANSDQVDLINSAKKMLPLLSSPSTSKFSRTRHEALYNLEQALNRNYTLGLPSMAVGVMFITSKTFRDFVLTSVREAGSNDNILTLDQVSKSLVITERGVFSNLLFALDYEEVFGMVALPTPTFLTFRTVLFAALQACVRSTVFCSSFDSADLLHFVGCMDDLVYVSAISSIWRSNARGHGAYSIEFSSDESDESVSSSTHSERDYNAFERREMTETEHERDSIQSHLAFLERRMSARFLEDIEARNEIEHLRRLLAELSQQ